MPFIKNPVPAPASKPEQKPRDYATSVFILLLLAWASFIQASCLCSGKIEDLRHWANTIPELLRSPIASDVLAINLHAAARMWQDEVHAYQTIGVIAAVLAATANIRSRKIRLSIQTTLWLIGVIAVGL